MLLGRAVILRAVPLLQKARHLSSEATSEMSFENIEVETKGHVRIISLNRPKKRNCVNRQTAEELYGAFQDFDSDEAVRVGILRGNGGTFCAGYDLSELAAVQGADVKELLRPFGEGAAPMGPSRTILSKPVIAAVTGHAVAGGLELSLMCDMRVAEEDAIFGVFCRRFGVPLIDGGTVRLPSLIGLSRAMDMILTGRPVGAKEALEMGLANRVVPKGKALEEALKLANQIAAFPQECLQVDRRSAYYSTYSKQTFIGSLAYEHRNGVKVLKKAAEGAGNFVRGVGKSGSFDHQSKL